MAACLLPAATPQPPFFRLYVTKQLSTAGGVVLGRGFQTFLFTLPTKARHGTSDHHMPMAPYLHNNNTDTILSQNTVTGSHTETESMAYTQPHAQIDLELGRNFSLFFNS